MLVTALLAASLGLQANDDRYVGFRADLSGKPARTAIQGEAHPFVFRHRGGERVRYRLVLRDLGDTVKRFRGRTNRRGRGRIVASLYVNDVGGPGCWRAVWRVKGKRVAGFRFKVAVEPEG